MASAVAYWCVCKGAAASVRLSPKAKAAYEKVQKGTDERSRKRKAHLKRYFSEFCENEPHRLSYQSYKKQETIKVNGKSVAIWTFKCWQWRLYGAVLNIDGNKCFVGVEIDEDKKQDKADKALLVAAAEHIASLHEFQG